MKELYKKKIYSYDNPKTNVYVVVCENKTIIDTPLGRYQVEIHTEDTAGFNVYIVELSYLRQAAIRESIRLEEILYHALKRFCPEDDDIDAFLKSVLDEYGYKYISFY